jgi:hypothetical protein
MNLICEGHKVDVGLVPQTVNNTNVIGRYFPMKDHTKAMAILQVGAMAATKVVTLEIFEGKTAAGTGGALIAGATCTITANTLVTKATVALASVLNTQTVTINGLVFTAHTNTTTLATRTFSISGDDTADAVELASCINDATYGVSGITAVAATGTITLTSTEPGETLITLAASDSTATLATVEAQAYVEIDNLDLSATFDHIAAKVTSTANGIVSVLLLREPRNSPVQKVGASAAL